MPPTPPRINLSNLQSIRREMAAVYRDMRSGRLDTQDGSRLVYSLGQIGKLIEVEVLERRLSELEALASGEQSQSQLLKYEDDEE